MTWKPGKDYHRQQKEIDLVIQNISTEKRVGEPTIQIQCGAKVETPETGPPKLTFQGYSGDSVDLWSYGFDYPAVYDIPSGIVNQKIPILYNHYNAVGHTTSIRKMDNNSAVRGKGVASIPGEQTNKIVEGSKNGFPWQASMGIKIPNWKDNISLHEKGPIEVNNRQFKGPIYVVKNWVLNEMTVTEFGRDADTSFEFLNQEKRMVIKNAAGTGTPAPDPIVTPPVPAPAPTPVIGNNTPPTPTPVLVNNTPPPTPVVPPTPAPAPTVTPTPVVQNTGVFTWDPTTRRALMLMNKHQGRFEIIEKGLSQGWDDEAIENAIALNKMNNDLPKPPSPGNKGPDFEKFLEARMCLSFGIKPETVEKQFGKPFAEKAHNLSKMGIGELLVNAANSSGGSFDGFSDIENVCKYLKNTGYSTFDLPDFFERVGRAMKTERWELNPPMARSICKEGSNKDFRVTEKVRITGGDMWQQVLADGKLDLWSAGGQKKYQTRLETYGTLFTMTLHDVINDDMDALSDMMDMMVEGAMMIPDYQLGLLLIDKAPAADTFWVDDGNSFDNTPLTRANLSARYNAIRQYTETKNRINWNVMLSERWTLMVSPNLEEAAWDIIKQDRVVNDTTANTKTGDKNYWFGKFDLKVFPQMANTSAFSSGSKFVGNTTWILWPSSLRFAPYEITYLRGQTSPTIESVDLPPTLLGFGTRGWWHVKVNERERTAVQRMTATA